ncbi:DUF4097 family beta strand repeat-containing protein [Haloarchaeobius sp. HME9146]|uniref:DUF4097 family beta strand repeat-containing protein n=1 Tax=Haloarchaeobius sp. HME9146 TaxID=2978732 RepID=UPI0021BE7FCC|nr:DUF4097 family beta strand repeat-containing protein [Haloarchaeobius sp. HME9146]MCT9095519.1 DUF4097 family beta strand repeat-containing protein [Haloarchaeobius sp. HME9146]
MPTESNRGFLGSLVDGIVEGATLGTGTETTTTVEETVDAATVERLTVESVNGDATLRLTDADTVTVTATKRTRADPDHLDRLRVTCEVTDGTLRVVVEPEDREAVRNVRAKADLDIAIPADVAVDHVEVVNGSVTLDSVSGDTHAEVANGSIDAIDVDGFVSLHAANGSVEARGCTGIDAAETANGSVDVEVRSLRRNAEVSSPNGSLTIRLAAGLDADVLAETLVGRVSVEDCELEVASQSFRRLLAIHGHGGYEVEASAVNGSVTVTRA